MSSALSTITTQLSLRGRKTLTTGASTSRQPLDPSNTVRLTEGDQAGQVDELSTVEVVVEGPTNEVQALEIDATGGTFTIAFNGSPVSPALDFDISAVDLQTALENLTTIAAGEVSVTGGPGGLDGTDPYFIVFQAALGNANQPLLVTDPANLTGGAMTANVTEERIGAVGTPTDIDLQAVLDLFDDPQNYTRINEILVRNLNFDDGTVLTDPGENLRVGDDGVVANPWQGFGTGYRRVFAGTDENTPGIDLWLNPTDDALGNVSGAANILRLISEKNRITAQLYILGVKA